MFTEITVVGVALDALERLAARFDREGGEIAEALARVLGKQARSRSKAPKGLREYIVVNASAVALAHEHVTKEDPWLAAALLEFKRALVLAGAPTVVIPLPMESRGPGGSARRRLLQPAFMEAATSVAPLCCSAQDGGEKPPWWIEDEAEFFRALEERAEWVEPRVDRLVRLVSRVAIALGFEEARRALVDRSIDGLFVQRAWAGFVTGVGYDVVRQRTGNSSNHYFGCVAAVGDGVLQALRAGCRITREAALACMFKGMREGLQGAAFVVGSREGEVTDAELEQVIADCVRAVLADERESAEAARFGLANRANPDLTALLHPILEEHAYKEGRGVQP